MMRDAFFDLQATINRFVEAKSADPKPFVWTVDPNRIIAAVNGASKGYSQPTGLV